LVRLRRLRIEMVKKPSKALEQRVLKSADRDEASTLAGFLDRLLGLQISIVDLSQRFDTWVQVKRRTYDLWFHLDDGCKERWALASAGEHRAVSPFVNKLARTLPRCPPIQRPKCE
jgi:hypothetical protein